MSRYCLQAIIVFALLLRLGVAEGGSASKESLAIRKLTTCFGLYDRFTEGMSPSSWEDFEKVLEHPSSEILDLPASILDYKRRYQLMSEPVRIQLYGRTFEVIAMAYNGDLSERPHSPEPSRFLIIRNRDERISSAAFGEAELQQAFERAGEDFSRYTKEVPLIVEPRESAPRNSFPQIEKPTKSASPPSSTDSGVVEKRESESTLFIAVMLLLLAIAVWVVARYRKK